MRIKFGIRAIAVLVASLSVCLAVLVFNYSKTCKAISVINAAGGSVRLASPEPTLGSHRTDCAKPSFGQYFNILAKGVDEVDLRDSEITNSVLSSVVDLRKIQDIYFDDSEVDDSQIQELRKLSQLRFLGIENTPVTEDGFEQLKKVFPVLETNRTFEADQLLGLIQSLSSSSQDELQLTVDP